MTASRGGHPTAFRERGHGLPRESVRRGLELSVADGALYALMVGFGEAYLLADAVRLGATPLELGLVVGLPLFAGGGGALAALQALAAGLRRKTIVVAGASAQVVALACLAALHFTGLVTPGLLIAFASVHQVGGQAAGLAWSSWIGDLVPEAVRGRYFGRRSRVVYGATLLGLVSSGLLLEAVEPGAAGEATTGTGGRGFAIVLAVATLARLGSAVLLGRTPEPGFGGMVGLRKAGRLLRATRGGATGRLLMSASGLHFVVYLAAPFFGPFMLEELRFSYVAYMASVAVTVVLKMLTLPAWGRAVDRYGARSVFALAAVLVAIVPLPWTWASGFLWVALAQALSGLSWGAHEISHFALLFEMTKRRTRPYAFAVQSSLFGGAQILGSIAGAALLAGLDGRYRLLFALTALARLALALPLPLLVPVSAGRAGVGRRALLARMIGLRPHGGPVHRPLLAGATIPAAACEPRVPLPRRRTGST